jgi:hypothetical protein
VIRLLFAKGWFWELVFWLAFIGLARTDCLLAHCQ